MDCSKENVLCDRDDVEEGKEIERVTQPARESN